MTSYPSWPVRWTSSRLSIGSRRADARLGVERLENRSVYAADASLAAALDDAGDDTAAAAAAGTTITGAAAGQEGEALTYQGDSTAAGATDFYAWTLTSPDGDTTTLAAGAVLLGGISICVTWLQAYLQARAEQLKK